MLEINIANNRHRSYLGRLVKTDKFNPNYTKSIDDIPPQFVLGRCATIGTIVDVVDVDRVIILDLLKPNTTVHTVYYQKELTLLEARMLFGSVEEHNPTDVKEFPNNVQQLGTFRDTFKTIQDGIAGVNFVGKPKKNSKVNPVERLKKTECPWGFILVRPAHTKDQRGLITAIVDDLEA